jgi:tetratricopeptide (TPR) repeat protein/DNA-binding XRE family transcriptional regulator
MIDEVAGFGPRLRAYREAAGLSQQELAERAGMSVRAVSNLERGRTRWPYPDSLSRLADGLVLADAARSQFISLAPRRIASAAGVLPGAPARAATVPGPLVTEAGREQPAVAGRTVPRQLPAAVPGFVGRDAQLAELSAMLDQPGGIAIITVIGGTPGVGKTALALHWAHQAAAEFPDGQLFVNLHGFSQSGPPLSAANAVRVLLEALDVPAARLPASVEAQLGMYRSLLAGRRMLIVLDNACDEAQVRPLLPGSLTCRVVITSRNQLTGLAALEAARLLMLDVLTDAEAHQLLRQRIGPGRLAAEPAAARQLIESAARLPLALSIIGARAAMRRDLALRQVAAELAARQDLGGFTAGHDPAADVRAALSWSYRQLPASTARAFRLAGLLPGPDLEVRALAALGGLSREQAGEALALLARGCLIQPVGGGRYVLHDLLRRYARELTAALDSGQARQAALARLLDYYLSAAAAAMDLVFSAERHRRPAVSLPATLRPPLATEQAALELLDAERPGIVAAIVVAAGSDAHAERAVTLAATLFRYLDAGAHASDGVQVHAAAARAARRLNDAGAQASALTNLGSAYLRQGRFGCAASHYQQAIGLYRMAGDRTGEARAVSNLGVADIEEGRLDRAAVGLRDAAALFGDVGDQAGEANSLANLAIVEHRRGEFTAAMAHARRSLEICREAGDRGSEAHALTIIGTISSRQGEHARAAGFHRQALAIARQVGDHCGVADILGNLGVAQLQLGQPGRAGASLRRALALATESGDVSLQAQLLNGLGEVHAAAGQPEQARASYAAALRIARETGGKHELARACYGLGESCQAAGDTRQARRHWHDAMALYEALGAPEAESVRARLDGAARSAGEPAG